MKSQLLVLSCLLALLGSQAWAQPKPASMSTAAQDQRAILAVLERQTAFWNEGKLASFMEGYWHSDSLQFIGSSGPTYGWQRTLDGYRQRYPNRATMGTLKFDQLRVQMLSHDAAFVVGRFFLSRPTKGDASGYFTLLWRKISGRWLITVDHTS